MIRKIMIESKDRDRLLNFDTERFDNVMKLIDECENKIEQEYIIGFDIAKKGSKDKSVMVKLRVVDGNLMYEGCEEI